MLGRTGPSTDLTKVSPAAVARPGECACEGWTAAERDRSRRDKQKLANVLTWRECGTVLDAVEVYLDECRYLCMEWGRRLHSVMFEWPAVAGKRGSQEGSHVAVVGSHACVRCLRLESDVRPLQIRLARRSRSFRDRDLSPVLRICMESTRANLLWQAAAVRPVPERMSSLRTLCGLENPYRTCLGLLVFCYIDKCCSKSNLRGRAIKRDALIGRVMRWDTRI